MTIQAIETHYNGYRFRSRLEARWAVFFNALNLTWEYEPEGFELTLEDWPPRKYLPDFRIRQGNNQIWVEVKGTESSVGAQQTVLDAYVAARSARFEHGENG
jgi:hypothetical protein